MKSFFLTLTAFALCVCSGVWQLRSQPSDNFTATIQFSDGTTQVVTDFSQPIHIAPNDVVNITMQFDPSIIGTPVLVDAVKGSTGVGGNIAVVGANGQLSFPFYSTAKHGNNPVSIHAGSLNPVLHFVVNG